LVLIETIDVLPRLFEQILVPTAVYDELAHADAPPPVRAFVAHKPAWLEVRSNPDLSGARRLARSWTRVSGPRSRSQHQSEPI
jgi:predicted nucleic acid-binding protein